MKRWKLIAITIFVSSSWKVQAFSEPIQKEWVKQDSIFIGEVTRAYKVNPLNVEYLLSYKGNRQEKLGFDYYEVSGSTGKGYVSLFYSLIYFHNRLISYQVSPEMPKDSRLIARYLRFYAALFGIRPNQTPQPLYYGYEEMSKALNPIKDNIVLDKSISFYMTPYSGTMYGNEGGWGSILDNRANYLAIKSKITPEICTFLLYSKNPATRLTAIEYYYQHLNQFSKQKEEFENRIKVIFNELPEVETMAADEVVTESAKELVHRFSDKP